MTNKKESVADLEAQRKEIDELIRRNKRIDAEINLQLLADKADSDSVEEIRKVVRACYQYIATHRRI